MSTSRIEFKKLSIPPEYGKILNNIFYVIENGKAEVMEMFRSLDSNTKDDIKDLICRMATVKDFRSPKIKYHLKGYSYGEIRPMPHRFFFFQRCGNNIIFFAYLLKKRNSFPDSVYNSLNKKRRNMQQHSNDVFKEIDDFFGSPPTVNQKAWGMINEFYHIILTYMEEHNISRADLARRLGKSRSAITQMFNKTPNMTIKRMVEIAEAIGIDIHIASSQIHQKERKEEKSHIESRYMRIPYQADTGIDTWMPSSMPENRYVNFQKGDVSLKASQYSHKTFVR